MIAGIVAVTLPGFAVGATVMALSNRGATAAVARARWHKFGVFFVIVHGVLVVAAVGQAWVVTLVLGILAAGAMELHAAWRRIATPGPLRIWVVFAAIAALAVWACLRLPPATFAFLFLVTAACDGFSQVVGQWLGRRPLAPRVSPGKTVGGFLGGLAAALAIGVLLRGLLPAGFAAAALLGVAAGVAGLAGDLAASWVKRRAGLKDYSAALPGQGGFLDRFDSLLGALALIGGGLTMAG